MKIRFAVLLSLWTIGIAGQQAGININRLKWIPDSHLFWVNESDGIQIYNPDSLNSKKLILTADQINTSGLTTGIENIVWNQNRTKILVYTNSFRVWRAKTKGDYWYYDLKPELVSK